MIQLTNAHVIVGDGRDLESGTVVVDRGRIVAVGTDGPRSADGPVVDLGGRTLIPGMIDMHTHMAGGDNAIGFGDEAKTFKMDEPIISAVFNTVDAAAVTLNAGITTARETLARDYIDVYLREAQKSGAVIAPRMVACGPGISMTGGHGAFADPDATADGVDAIVRRVRQLVANRVDWVKVISADGPETAGRWETEQTTFEEMAAAFAEVRRLGRYPLAHAMGPAGIGNAVKAGARTIEHGWYISEENCADMVARGTYFTPTLGNVVDVLNKGPALQMPWAEIMQNDGDAIFARHRMAIEMGVKVVMGSDCGGNEARLHGANADELVCYVRCGMTPMDAIRSATQIAAECLGLDGEIGAIAVGKVADLVILEGDPLTDIEQVVRGVVGVVQGGSVIRDDHGLLDDVRRVNNDVRTTTTTAIHPTLTR